MNWESIANYVDPKLIVVAVALYFVGMGLKKTEKIDDKFIPMVLAGIGIVLAGLFIFATGTFVTVQDIALGIFNAIVQGVIVGALPVWVNQNVKQLSTKG